MLVLLSYIWADEYWVRAYNIPDYRAEASGIPRIAQFHFPSVLLGAALIAAAVIYKKLFSSSPDGFPWYFTYLTLASIVPSAGFFRTAQPFINWRAFSFTFFLILLISLLWEATLANPVRLVGLPAANDAGPRHRRLVRPASRGRLRLVRRELYTPSSPTKSSRSGRRWEKARWRRFLVSANSNTWRHSKRATAGKEFGET